MNSQNQNRKTSNKNSYFYNNAADEEILPDEESVSNEFLNAMEDDCKTNENSDLNYRLNKVFDDLRFLDDLELPQVNEELEDRRYNNVITNTVIAENNFHQEVQQNVATSLYYQFASRNDQPSTPFNLVNQPNGGIAYYLNNTLSGNSQSVMNQNSPLEVGIAVQNEAVQTSLDGTGLSTNIFNQLEPQNFQNWNQVQSFENTTTFPQFNIGSTSHEHMSINHNIYHSNGTAESCNSCNKPLQFQALVVPSTHEQDKSVCSSTVLNTDNITSDVRQELTIEDWLLLNNPNSPPSNEVGTSSLHNSSCISEETDTPCDAFKLLDLLNSPTKDKPSNTNETHSSQLLSNAFASISNENVTSDVKNGIASIERHQTHNLVSSSGLNAELKEIPIQAQKFEKLNSPPKVIPIINTTEIDQFDKKSLKVNGRRKQVLQPIRYDHLDLHMKNFGNIANIKPAADNINNISSEMKIFHEPSTSKVGESSTDLISDTFDEASFSSKQPKQPPAKKIKLSKKSIKSRKKTVQPTGERQLRSSKRPVRSYKEDSDDDDYKKLKPIVDKEVIKGIDSISLDFPQRDLLEKSNVNLKNSEQNKPEEVNNHIRNIQPKQANEDRNITYYNNIPVSNRFQKAFEDFAKNFNLNR